jgi:hypothetical protein
VADPVDRHLHLLHALEQRRLGLGRGPVDLVHEHEVREHRARLELELVVLEVEDAHAGDVRRQQVRRRLHPRELAVEGAGQGLREHRLADAREVLEDHVAFAQHGHDAAGDQRSRRVDHARDVLDHPLGGFGGGGDISGRSLPSEFVCFHLDVSFL